MAAPAPTVVSALGFGNFTNVQNFTKKVNIYLKNNLYFLSHKGRINFTFLGNYQVYGYRYVLSLKLIKYF